LYPSSIDLVNLSTTNLPRGRGVLTLLVLPVLPERSRSCSLLCSDALILFHSSLFE